MKAQKLRIRAYSLFANTEIIDSSFALLEQAVKDIQAKTANHHSFEELYRTCYTLVLHKQAGRLYELLKKLIKCDIDEKLLKLLEINNNDKFVSSLLSYWKDNRLCLSMIRDVFMYLDRTYAVPEKQDDIITLGTREFKKQILSKQDVAAVLVIYLMDLITRERKGEMTDLKTLKDTCNMLLEMDVKDGHVFIKIFENNFIQETKVYLDDKIRNLLRESDLVLFINQLTCVVEKEMSFVSSTFPRTTVNKIAQVIENIFHSDIINSVLQMRINDMKFLIRNRNFRELKMLTTLFAHSDTSVKSICQFIAHYLKESTYEALSLSCENKTDIDPLNFVSELVNYKIMYDSLMSQCFKKFPFVDKYFAKVLEDLVNSNKKSPLILSQYMDMKINKHGSSESEIVRCEPLDNCIYLFRLCWNKDVFEKHYRRFMMKRLLSANVNRDLEIYSISLLNSECGMNFVQHMYTMISDYSYSLEFLNLLSKYLNDANISFGVSISIKILDYRAWPTTEAPPFPQCVPLGITNAWKEIKHFYSINKESRKLSVHPRLGSVEIRSTFYNKIDNKVVPKTYVLEVSFYQMCILNLFNDTKSLSYERIEELLNIDEEDLNASLASLAAGKSSSKILNKTPNSLNIEKTDVFEVNDQFISKKYRIKVQTLVSKKEKEKVQNKDDESVEVSRICELEAAIVRVMKKRLKLSHQQLVVETTREVQSRFKPQPAAINNAINTLIQKEFLKKDLNQEDAYIYIS